MKTKEKLLLSVSSIILFVFSAIIAYIPFQVSFYFIADFFDISLKLEHYKIIVTTPTGSPLWTNISVISLYGFPSILSFVLANITRKVYDNARKRKSNYKLFLAWLNLHFDNLFWGSIIAGIITSTDFAYFLEWLYIPLVAQIFIAIAGIILFYSLSNFSIQSFIQTSHVRVYINKENQLKYKFFIMYLPLIIGTFLFIAISFPHSGLHERILNLTLLIPLINTIKYHDEENVKLVKNSKTFQPNYGIIIFIIAYILILQFI